MDIIGKLNITGGTGGVMPTSTLHVDGDMTLGNGGTSDIKLHNVASGNQLNIGPFTGTNNTVTLQLGSTGGITEFNTSGGAWSTNKNWRFDTSTTAGIYCNNSDQGLSINGDNTLAGNIFISAQPESNVGIGNGIVLPEARLVVKGSGDTSATNAFLIKDKNSAIIMVAEDGGNVGIGTSTPTEMLDVRKNQAAYSYISSDNQGTVTGGTGSGFAMKEGGATAWYMRSERDGSGKFNIGSSTGTNRLTIDTTGKVGIGTTSPAEKLEVLGNILLTSGANRSIAIGNVASGTAPLLTINGSNTPTDFAAAGGIDIVGGTGSGIAGQGGIININGGTGGSSAKGNVVLNTVVTIGNATGFACVGAGSFSSMLTTTGRAYSIVNVTAATTLTTDVDMVFCTSIPSTFNTSLPTNPVTGQKITFRNNVFSGNNWNIAYNGHGIFLFGGGSSVTLVAITAYQAKTFVYNGTGWYQVA